MMSLLSLRRILSPSTVFILVLLCFLNVIYSTKALPPPEWTCSPSWYEAFDGCDCGCGAKDPDCDYPPATVWNCPQPLNGTVTCSSIGECVYSNGLEPHIPSPAPSSWTCNPIWYDALDGCDCGCGTWDPDCDQSSLTYGCLSFETCEFPGVCVGERPPNPPGVPASWTCDPSYYNALDGCDCDCGAPDPDCDVPFTLIYNCLPGATCVAGVCQLINNPTCPYPTTCPFSTCTQCGNILSSLQGYPAPSGSYLTTFLGKEVSVYTEFPVAPNCLTTGEYDSSQRCTPYSSPMAYAFCNPLWEISSPYCESADIPLISACELSGDATTCTLQPLNPMMAPAIDWFTFYANFFIPSLSSLPSSLQDLLDFRFDILMGPTAQISYQSSPEFLLGTGTWQLKRIVQDDSSFVFFVQARPLTPIQFIDGYISLIGASVQFDSIYLSLTDSSWTGSYLSRLTTTDSDVTFDKSTLDIMYTWISIYHSAITTGVGLRFTESDFSATSSRISVQGVLSYNSPSPKVFSLSDCNLFLEDSFAQLSLVGRVDMDNSYLYIYGGLALIGSVNSGRTYLTLTSSRLIMDQTSTGGDFLLQVRNADIDLEGSLLQIFGGNFEAYDSSTIYLYLSKVELSNTMLLSGSVYVLAEISGIWLQGGGTSQLVLEETAYLETSDTSLQIEGQLIVSDQATIKTVVSKFFLSAGGNCSVEGSSFVSMWFGSLSVDGSLTISGNSTVHFNYTTTASLGEISVLNFSTLFLNRTLSYVSDGSMVLSDQSELIGLAAALLLEGGSIFLSGEHAASFYLSEIVLLNGSFIANDFATLDLENTGLYLEGGNFELLGNSQMIVGSNSDLHVRNGTFLAADHAAFLVESGGQIFIPNGTFELRDYSKLFVIEASLIVNGGSLFVEDNSELWLSLNSIIWVYSGTVSFSGSAALGFDYSIIYVQDNSDNNVFDRLFEINQNRRVLVTNESALFIDNGSLYVEDSAQLSVSSLSIIDIINGSILLGDYSVLINTYAVVAIHTGEISLRNHSSYLVTDGFTLVAANSTTGTSGSLLLWDDSLVNSIRSGFVIQDGGVSLRNNSRLILDASEANILSGSLSAFDRALVHLKPASLFTVTNGSLLLSDSSVLTNNANVSIVGGEIRLDKNSSFVSIDGTTLVATNTSTSTTGLFSVTDQATVNTTNSFFGVKGGDVIFSGSSTLRSIRSTLSVLYGSMELLGTSKFFGSDKTAVLIRGGNLNAKENSSIELEDSSFSVLGGTATVLSSASLQAKAGTVVVSGGRLKIDGSFKASKNAKVEVRGGDFLVGVNARASLSSSKGLVSSGSLFISGTSHFEISNSHFEVNGGDIVVSENGSLSVVEDSKFTVSQGSVKIIDSGFMIIDGSSGKIEGGDFVVKDNGVLKLVHQSQVKITGGQLRVSESARVQILDKSFVQNGKKIIGGGKYSIPGSSGLEVTVDGVMEIDESMEIASRTDDEGGTVVNSGTWNHDLRKGTHSISVPFKNRGGKAKFSQGAVTFTDFEQEGGETLLEDATFHAGDSKPVLVSGGRFKGVGSIRGALKTNTGGTVGAGDDTGVLLEVDGDMDHSGAYEVAVDGTDTGKKNGNGHGQVKVKGHLNLREDSEIVVCLKKNKKFAEGTKIDVMTYKTLHGKFKSVKFECPGDKEQENHKRARRDLEEEEEALACPPSLQFGGGTIAVLFGVCVGGGDGGGSTFSTWSIIALCLLGGAIILSILIAISPSYILPIRVAIYGYDKQKDPLECIERYHRNSEAQKLSLHNVSDANSEIL